jgi:hypothetical protein
VRKSAAQVPEHLGVGAAGFLQGNRFLTGRLRLFRGRSRLLSPVTTQAVSFGPKPSHIWKKGVVRSICACAHSAAAVYSGAIVAKTALRAAACAAAGRPLKSRCNEFLFPPRFAKSDTLSREEPNEVRHAHAVEE